MDGGYPKRKGEDDEQANRAHEARKRQPKAVRGRHRNAVGLGAVDELSCRRVKDRIEREYKPAGGDLTVIGVSHQNNVFPAHGWQGARIVLKEGHDGADLALEAVLSSENIEERFSEVVIVSGDGLFAKQAARLRSLGVKVTVDARARQLSRFLAFSCSSVRLAPSAIAA